jgi:hypothetical protein
LHWLTFIALNYGFWFNPFGVSISGIHRITFALKLQLQ